MEAGNWIELIALIFTMVSGGFAMLSHFDRRQDKVESDLKLIGYRLEQVEAECSRHNAGVAKAITQITAWAAKQGFSPRGQRSDGSPCPSDDTPTMGYKR